MPMSVIPTVLRMADVPDAEAWLPPLAAARARNTAIPVTAAWARMSVMVLMNGWARGAGDRPPVRACRFSWEATAR